MLSFLVSSDLLVWSLNQSCSERKLERAAGVKSLGSASPNITHTQVKLESHRIRSAKWINRYWMKFFLNTVSGSQKYFLGLVWIKSQTSFVPMYKLSIIKMYHMLSCKSRRASKDCQKQGDKFPLKATAGKETACLYFLQLPECWWKWIGRAWLWLGSRKLHVDWLDLEIVYYGVSNVHAWLNKLRLWDFAVSFSILAIVKKKKPMKWDFPVTFYTHSHAAKWGINL